MFKNRSKKQLLLFFIAAFIIRGALLFFIIQPYEFYRQPDSNDYHQCALNIALGHGMYSPNHKPMFWRTPGYPLYLAFFYVLYGVKQYEFRHNSPAQKAALWLQVFLTSCIPIILFYLALLLTSNYHIALLLGWISVFHPGLIFASTYLLTEGIALIFFYAFLLFLYRYCINKNSYKNIIAAAVSLSLYTWIRPMGEFIGYVSPLFIFCYAPFSWKQNGKKALLFLCIFIASIAPWYWRNYQLTHELFFCPTLGPYLTCFSVPKILRRTLGKPLIECHTFAQQLAGTAVYKKTAAATAQRLHVAPTACKDAAIPIVMQHPWYFVYDWIIETIKTTYDLYTYQIIPMLNSTYWYDPLEESLSEKISDCLYVYPMAWYFRIICWIEFCLSCLMWFGLASGFYLFIIQPLIYNSFFNHVTKLWILCLPMIAIIIGMTGGFGYARLRLPAEPLLIILSLTFWMWLSHRHTKETS